MVQVLLPALKNKPLPYKKKLPIG